VRTAYLGTSEFAGTVLRRLADSPHRPALVATPPDSRRGRGRKLAPPPAATAARELGLGLHQTANVNAAESLAAIREARPEAIGVCAFGQLIREPLLSEFLMLNVHPSLVPRWRGAAPIERAIEAGDEETGVTIMRPTAELDAGPLCLQRSEPIDPHDDYGSLAARLAALGGELLIEALDTHPPFRDQPDQGATYAGKVDAPDRWLDPDQPADQLERRVRALTPHIGAYGELDGGERLGVRRAVLAAGVDDVPPGELIERDGTLLYGSAQGALELIEVRPSGKKAMEASAWLRGRR
jgi:methionyl-tRNA formyltransferase